MTAAIVLSSSVLTVLLVAVLVCQGALENRPVMGASKPASGHGLDRNSDNNCDEST